MILKTVLAVSFVAATPFVLMSSAGAPQDPQDPHRRQAPRAEATTGRETSNENRRQTPRSAEDLRAEVERLRRQVERERARVKRETTRAEQAEAEIDRALEELGEALDLLSAEESRERNCSPSRNLITRHEWFQRRGHEAHASRMMDRISAAYRDDASRLNRLAWSLMTDEATVGQFDGTALAIATRIENAFDVDELPHQILDTIAFANFLSGQIARAIELERAALETKDRSEYRRRLRTYEAAMVAMETAQRATTPDAVATAVETEQQSAVPATYAAAFGDDGED